VSSEAAGTHQTVAAEPVAIRFDEVSAAQGFDFTYHNDEEQDRFSIVESLGGGVALLDYDGDGWLDVWLPGGGRFSGPREIRGRPNGLYRSHGTGSDFVSVAEAAGVTTELFYSHGVSVADADEDGFPDVLVTGYGGLQFFRNRGDGTFAELAVTASLVDPQWSSSAAWGDFDGDGVLDLYVAHYVNWSFDNDPSCPGVAPHERDVCPPRRFDPLPDALFLGDGEGGFRDATREAGLRNDGKGLSVIACDIDGDGDLDVYVANDTVENFLYVNDGRGHFEDASVVSGAAYNERGLPDGSMGIDLFDFDADRLPDLFVTNFEGENSALYKNMGGAVFRHVSQQTGISAVGQMYVGWGIRAEDLDNDGDQDVAIVNGHVVRFPHGGSPAQAPMLFLNRGGAFANVAPEVGGYFGRRHRSRGLATGDLNRDGRIDLVTSNVNQPAVTLLNRTENAHGFLQVQLVGTSSPRSAIGAKVELETTTGRQSRQVTGGGSYASTSDLAVHFGRGNGTSDATLHITWPSGERQSFPIADSRSDWIAIEGRTRLESRGVSPLPLRSPKLLSQDQPVRSLLPRLRGRRWPKAG